MRRVPGGYIYAVPVGFTFHCPVCPRGVVLQAGDECFVKNFDDSHVYCRSHFPFLGPKRADEMEQEEEQARVPRRGHRREPYEQMVW